MEIKTDFRMLPLAEIDTNEGQVAGVKVNPRTISEKDYKKLLKSLRASNLTDILPLKVYKHGERYVTIGGNMRLRALRELGEKETPCIVIPEDTPADVLNKAIILDNSTHGEWDWDMLANEWTDEPLEDWGVSVPEEKETERLSTLEFKPLYYTPENFPELRLEDCVNFEVYDAKMKAIEELGLPQDIEKVMSYFAARFIKIDFESVANYYFFNASEDEKKALERLRMVLTDNGLGGYIEDALLKIKNNVNNYGDEE